MIADKLIRTVIVPAIIAVIGISILSAVWAVSVSGLTGQFYNTSYNIFISSGNAIPSTLIAAAVLVLGAFVSFARAAN
jgi:hypothetical protein